MLNAKLLTALLPARSTLRTTLPVLALPPGSLTHEQLESQLQLAWDAGDFEWSLDVRKASGRIIGGRRCPHAMARCVDRQAEIELTASLDRAVAVALGRPELSREDLLQLGRRAMEAGDLDLLADVGIAEFSDAAMARCVDAALRCEPVLPLDDRVEYQPWSSTAVAEVV